jgi:hypothetical protein
MRKIGNIEFCERKMFEILNGKYGEDTKGYFTFVSQIGKSVVDYALKQSETVAARSEELQSCSIPLIL